jgi:hypothetical protein
MSKASPAQIKLLNELRAKELKDLSAADFAIVEREFQDKGIRGIKGSTAQLIFGAIRERDKEMKKAKSLKTGDMVSWSSSGGTARGKVEHIMREGVLGIPESSFSIKAEKDDPAVLIRIYKDGEETETLVGHKMSTLRKNKSVKKHGEHDQASHGSWSENPKNTDNPRNMDTMDMGRPQTTYKPSAAQRKLINRITSPASSQYLPNRPFGGVEFQNTWVKNGKQIIGYTPKPSENS